MLSHIQKWEMYIFPQEFINIFWCLACNFNAILILLYTKMMNVHTVLRHCIWGWSCLNNMHLLKCRHDSQKECLGISLTINTRYQTPKGTMIPYVLYPTMALLVKQCDDCCPELESSYEISIVFIDVIGFWRKAIALLQQ